MTGSDTGPKSESSMSYWDMKVISISTNRANIEFKSGYFSGDKGFSANIHFIPIPNKECELWLNMTKKIFKSPNYPQTYYNSSKCSWLITVNHDQHITLDVTEFYVRY